MKVYLNTYYNIHVTIIYTHNYIYSSVTYILHAFSGITPLENLGDISEITRWFVSLDTMLKE